MHTLKLVSSQLMTLLYTLNGAGMARLSRLAPGFALSVISDLLSWRFLQSTLKTLVNTLARPGMHWVKLSPLLLLGLIFTSVTTMSDCFKAIALKQSLSGDCSKEITLK
jgi:hypothetical protein